VLVPGRGNPGAQQAGGFVHGLEHRRKEGQEANVLMWSFSRCDEIGSIELVVRRDRE
jgi:hypothetical protein